MIIDTYPSELGIKKHLTRIDTDKTPSNTWISIIYDSCIQLARSLLTMTATKGVIIGTIFEESVDVIAPW